MGLYPLNCPCCDKVFTDRKPFSKHKSTQKYKNNMLQKENYKLKLDLEIYKLQNNINITINNVDNSKNIINNIFVFNTPERMNWSVFINEIPDVDDIYSCGEFNADETIRKQFLKIPRELRPVMRRQPDDWVVKEDDKVFKGEEAKEKIGTGLKNLSNKWLSQNPYPEDMTNESACIKWMKVQGDVFPTCDTIFQKLKCELKYKITDK